MRTNTPGALRRLMWTGANASGRAMEWWGCSCQATSRKRRIASRMISLVVVCSAWARTSIAARSSGSIRAGTTSAGPDPNRGSTTAPGLEDFDVVLGLGGLGREGVDLLVGEDAAALGATGLRFGHGMSSLVCG